MSDIHNRTWATNPALMPWRIPGNDEPEHPHSQGPASPSPIGGLDQPPADNTTLGGSSPPPPPVTECTRSADPANLIMAPPTSPVEQMMERPGHAGPTFVFNDLISHRRARPTHGWRAALYTATGGRCNAGPSAADAERRRLLARVRTPLPGLRQIAVTSLKGGIGKTTITAGLGLTLAEHRGDRIIALDANPDAGTLADRLTGHVGITIRDLIDNIDTIRSWTDMAHYTSLAGRLHVLASEQDPAMSEAFNRDEYHAVVTKLAEFNNVIITDSGTGLVHSAMGGALDAAHTLVIAGSPTLDGASRASKTLDWLVAHGYRHLVEGAVVVLSHDRASRHINTETIREHFLNRCHAVVDIPPDPHLAIGGPINLGELRPRTRDAFLQLAAHVADQFSCNTVRTTRPHRSTRQESI
jgi:MinD-like ATPase involved in chromosome partitioning or flagellar assembly